MRCKVGDLAVYVGSPGFPLENVGHVARCVSLIPKYEGHWDAAWVIEPPFRFSSRGARRDACADSLLRPIRDGEGQDETLTWAGLPASFPKEVA